MQQPRWSFVREHVAIVGSVMLASLTALRLLQVAHGDPVTAVAILQHAGTANVIFGSLITVFPVLLMGIAVIVLSSHTDLRMALFPYLFAVLLMPFWFGAIVALPMLAVVGVFAAKVQRMVRSVRRMPHAPLVPNVWDAVGGPLFRRKGIKALVAVVPISWFLSLGDTMWLPAERVEMDGTVVIGYILSASDGTTVILRENNREVLIERSDISDRRLCHLDELRLGPEWMNGSPLPWLMGDRQRPDYDVCAD